MKIENMSEKSYQKILDAQKRGAETRKKDYALKRIEYYKNPELCLWCNKPINYECRKRQKFCCLECAYNSFKTNNSEKICHEETLEDVPENMKCLRCGKRKSRKTSIFCSLSCHNQYKKEKIICDIENNNIVSTNVLRDYIMNLYNSKCQKCGWGIPNPTSGTVCLDMHHIDGDYKNNKLSNVELLCPNCHSLTINYKNAGKNRESTRTYRKT